MPLFARFAFCSGSASPANLALRESGYNSSCRPPQSCALHSDPAGTSAIGVTCTSGNVSHAATAQLTLELSQSNDSTTLLREPRLPATERSLLAFNLRASLLDASLNQLGFHFFLLPGKKRHVGFKCPIARQRDFDPMLSRTHR